jgi:beta-glucanase (GH16 family)
MLLKFIVINGSILCLLLSGCDFISNFEMGSAKATPNPIPSGYKLVWSDEFNGSGFPDSKKWDYNVSANKLGWNGEAQYYTQDRLENARVSNGVLTIEARKESLDPKIYYGHIGQKYTSARINTKARRGFTYGFFDVRAKVPCGRGTWPAIWLRSSPPHERWPDDGEMDIVEYVGYKPNIAYATIHSRGTQTNPVQGKRHIPNACHSFHNYQMDWRPDSITFLIDGVQILREERRGRGYADWPYNHEFYLIMNFAVGGKWGGKEGIDPNAFPTRMQVDYVRVYQPSLYYFKLYALQ